MRTNDDFSELDKAMSEKLRKPENQYPVECPKCQGSGWTFDSSPAPNAFMMPECEECNGKGEIIYEE
jgi:DnaJ-class molecular chaperone